MSSDIAIKVENLSKCYHIYDKPRDRLAQMFFWGRRQFYREFWALKDVSFEIKKGETVGIIGRNGSGKSTLLQLICGTLAQTTGTIQTNGRVAALLELGSGFNPEFTGRENVYLNAAILGLEPEGVDACYDDIVRFADIGSFVDEPVKTYSSGMLIRLAFAVQAQIRPDILVVDEALAVGDAAFQSKCYDRIEELKESGCTIVLVSHSLDMIIRLSDRAMILNRGKPLYLGDISQAAELYRRMITTEGLREDEVPALCKANKMKDYPSGRGLPVIETHNVMGNRHVRISDFGVYNAAGQLTCSHMTGELYRIEVTCTSDIPVHNLIVAFQLFTADGLSACGAKAHYAGPLQAGGSLGVTFLQRLVLAPGDYLLGISCATVEPEGLKVFHRMRGLLILSVQQSSPSSGCLGFAWSPTTEIRFKEY